MQAQLLPPPSQTPSKLSHLEHGGKTLVLEDLCSAVESRGVLDCGTRGHHHATTDGVNGVRGHSSEVGDTPSEDEGGEEVILQG